MRREEGKIPLLDLRLAGGCHPTGQGVPKATQSPRHRGDTCPALTAGFGGYFPIFLMQRKCINPGENVQQLTANSVAKHHSLSLEML